ncbi:MAG: signal recognition particle receptor subunit alpha, partial [Synergistota bacterium]|nr:signal recognition particle receptor subunit alpha [Synergistota bacterium]
MFETLKERLEGVFKGLKNRGKLTEDDISQALRDVRRALLEGDVNYKIAKGFVAGVREKLLEKKVLDSVTPGQQVVAVVYEELTALMGGKGERLQVSPKPPSRYLFVGLQGSGKTTSCVKVAKKIAHGHKPLVVACDLRRPAAVKQLEVLAGQEGIGFLGPGEKDADALSVAESSIDYAAERLHDVVIYDTAGRLQVDEDLMGELESLKKLLKPAEILLVLDAMTGQEALNVASTFHERLGVTGLVLTKMDGDARGGAALSALAVTGVPVKFVGVGE